MADTVQTFRAISWLIFKWLLIALAVMAALAAAGVAIHYGLTWYNYDRHAAKIEPVVRYSANSTPCDKHPNHPLFVAFVNNSNQTIDKVDFVIQAKIPGRSSVVANSGYLSMDFIIKPTDGMGNCFELPKVNAFTMDLSGLTWSLSYVRYTFAD